MASEVDSRGRPVTLDAPPPSQYSVPAEAQPSLAQLTRQQGEQEGESGLPVLGDMQVQGIALQLSAGTAKVLEKLAELMPDSAEEFIQIRQLLVSAVQRGLLGRRTQGLSGTGPYAGPSML